MYIVNCLQLIAATAVKTVETETRCKIATALFFPQMPMSVSSHEAAERNASEAGNTLSKIQKPTVNANPVATVRAPRSGNTNG